MVKLSVGSKNIERVLVRAGVRMWSGNYLAKDKEPWRALLNTT
jgi:hypothetical protein